MIHHRRDRQTLWLGPMVCFSSMREGRASVTIINSKREGPSLQGDCDAVSNFHAADADFVIA
jgi:hypothetical protein